MTEPLYLTTIRENERQSHIAIYSKYSLFAEGSWLKNPVKTVLELFPILDEYVAAVVHPWPGALYTLVAGN